MNYPLRGAGQDADRLFRGPGQEAMQRGAERSLAAQQASSAGKLAELNLLAGSLAHELRNSLAVVTTALEVLGNEYAGNGERGQIFKEIARRLDDLRQMAGNLVDYSKPLVPKKVRVRLIEVLDAVVAASVTRDNRLRASLWSSSTGAIRCCGQIPTCWSACS